MAEPDRPERSTEGHPIVAGLTALVGVGVVVGLILGLVVFAGTKVLGLGGDDEVKNADDQQTLYVPKPEKTTASSGPAITLAPGEETSSASGGTKSTEPTESESPDRKITLSASSTAASAMEQVTLSGVYPGGEGAILQVQRLTDGHWQDFPVTVSVSGEQFQTYVQTSAPGVNRFRVVDTDTDTASNVVRFTIG